MEYGEKVYIFFKISNIPVFSPNRVYDLTTWEDHHAKSPDVSPFRACKAFWEIGTGYSRHMTHLGRHKRLDAVFAEEFDLLFVNLKSVIDYLQQRLICDR